MTQRTGWQIVVEALKCEGVKYVFGLPGAPVHLYDALYDEPAITPILARHETAGAFMALAYALLTRQPAVCFASPGPGVANLAPAMLECLATCAPVIAPCTGVDGRTDGKGAFQETDQVGLMRPITKWATRVACVEKVPWTMRRAFSLATNGQPGPIFVEIPAEVGTSRAAAPPYVPAERQIRCAGDPARVREAVALLAAARRPLLVAGGGARLSGAHAEVRQFIELLGMPLLTTPSGRGIVAEDHPLSIGQVGLYRTRLGKQAVQEADVLITVGSRNEESQTNAWRYFPPNAKFIQIDIAPFEIGRNWIPNVAILGDAKLVLADMSALLAQRVDSQWSVRGEEWGLSKKAYKAQVDEECRREPAILQTKRILYELNQVYGKDTVLVHENGSQDLWSYYSPYYMVLDMDSVVAPGEQTCMGMGVAGAIGAKLARPDKKVVCVTGDGAFQMANQEIPTSMQHHAPVTWLVLNNSCLGWPKYGQTRLGGRYIATDFKVQPDFVGLAKAYGGFSERIDHPDGARGALERAMRANADGVSAVLDCVICTDDLPEGFHEYQNYRYLTK
jgi:acetolactate synthase I/II/III large subunit